LVLVCYAATQLATQLQQRCIQVVRSNKEARKRLTESNGSLSLSLSLSPSLSLSLSLALSLSHTHTHLIQWLVVQDTHTLPLALSLSHTHTHIHKHTLSQGADLTSTNGEPWRHAPLHQVCVCVLQPAATRCNTPQHIQVHVCLCDDA